MKLTRKAHAKLNLFLEVTGKRVEGKYAGYHELFSLAVFLDLADEITVEPAAAISLRQTNGDAGILDNIIYKTALLLAQKYNVISGARITFTKNIPIGGGLGGGSADAATTLVLLNTLWKLNLSQSELYETALQLGADVPVCLYSILENRNAAIFKGIGEVLEPAPELPQMFFTLANPAVEVSTKEVFSHFKYEGLGYEPLAKTGDFFENIIMRSNDLEPAAIALVPNIAVALDELQTSKNCILSRMTGSGGTSFGIFKRRRDAREAAVTLIKKHPDWQIGPVGLKKTSAYKTLEKIKRPFLKTQVRAVKSIRGRLRNSKTVQSFTELLQRFNIKTRLARNFGLSTTIHLVVFLLLGIVFVYQKYMPEPEYVTVSFGIEKPVISSIIANDLEPASGAEDKDVDAMLKTLPPVPEPAKIKTAKKAVPKKTDIKKLASNNSAGGKAGAVGASNGNTPKPNQAPPKDYLGLLQYTVQERSAVPNDPNLKGRAVLHLAFNRDGYVLAYALKQSTGSPVLDKAAENVAKNLMDVPFPAAPKDFDFGDDILEYDFVISYPHKARS